MPQKFSIYNQLIEDGFSKITKIQSLWSGYGAIYRLENQQGEGVIVKHINPPTIQQHPRNWNTSTSHQRKLKSYQVEYYWYKEYQKICKPTFKVPTMINASAIGSEQLLILEDLAKVGYPTLKSSINKVTIKVVLKWLANFHASFIHQKPKGLWQTGSYWHLDTRPDEFASMQEGALKINASAIDAKLNNATYKTIVHGDAKLANFCFSEDLQQVAGVDFQYTGGGCGMKDVAYFLGSCLHNHDLEKFEEELLTFYFIELKSQLPEHINATALTSEWTLLYPFAWADFERFLLGWAPGHQKLTSYSTKMTNKALQILGR